MRAGVNRPLRSTVRCAKDLGKNNLFILQEDATLDEWRTLTPLLRWEKFQTLGSLMDAPLWAACPPQRGGVTAVWDVSDDDPPASLSSKTRRGAAKPSRRVRGCAVPAGVANVSVSATGSSSKKALVEPSTRGDPQALDLSRHLADALVGRGHQVSRTVLLWRTTVCRPTERLLIPTATPSSHISKKVCLYQSIRKRRNPEMGLEWQPQGSPDKVRVHDFKEERPYGIYAKVG